MSTRGQDFWDSPFLMVRLLPFDPNMFVSDFASAFDVEEPVKFTLLISSTQLTIDPAFRDDEDEISQVAKPTSKS